ncbi:MAG: hypothetical protein LBU27_02365 [Candidatus Peribacteria bacterium]|jgi:hypothetical protein|nr:hypothetical protein [Candidatus Peribacteria bacterium]
MKKIFVVLLLQLVVVGGMAQQNSASHVAPKKATEWIAVKASAIDSVSLAYYTAKGLVSMNEPKTENNNVFMVVSSYIASLLDETLSSVSRNANQFYDTPVGFWATWGVFYKYAGSEVMEYFREIIYLLVITILFVCYWRRYCIPRMVPTEDFRQKVSIAKGEVVSYKLKPTFIALQSIFLLVYFVLFFIAIVLICN